MAAGKKNGGGGGLSLIFRLTLLICLGLTLVHSVDANNYKGGKRCRNGKDPQTKEEYEKRRKQDDYNQEDVVEKSAISYTQANCLSKNCTYDQTVGQAVCDYPNYENGVRCKDGNEAQFHGDIWKLYLQPSSTLTSEADRLVKEAKQSEKEDKDNCKSKYCFWAGKQISGEAVCKEQGPSTSKPGPGGKGSSSIIQPLSGLIFAVILIGLSLRQVLR